MVDFTEFLKQYPPAVDLPKPDAEVLAQFQEILPAELLELWQQYGLGAYGNGLLKMINPADYQDSLYTWLGNEDPTRLPIMITAFGNIFYYRRLSATEDDVCLLDIHYRQIITCAYSFQEFFEEFITDEEITAEVLNKELFARAIEEKGALAEEEIFCFVPALMLGGSASVESLEKGKAVVHQQLLFELGANHSEEDAWSQTAEAEPQVFELEDGSLMASFTFAESLDIILPAAPETIYKIEGETISQWAVMFVSLTKNETLGVLPYETALQRLQPYVLETRGDYLRIRGLTLEEMTAVLTGN